MRLELSLDLNRKSFCGDVCMPENLVLKTKKNELFQYAEKLGLNTGDFRWEKVKSKSIRNLLVSKLVHIPTNHYILFDYDRYADLIIYRDPGLEQGYEKIHARKDRDAPSDPVKQGVNWMNFLKREIEVPNLWEAAAFEAEIIGFDPLNIENEPFSQDEREALEKGLNELREYIATTHQLTGQHLKELNASIEYLKGSTDRSGRLDWRGIFVNTIINLAIRLSYDAGFIHEAFRFMGGLIIQSPGLESLSP